MKILIVDDENLASSRVKRLLNELGYEDITIFNDSVEAFHHVSNNKYDLVFLDINMPIISGLELANEIIEREANTFIIFQTAYEEYALEAFKVGGVDYLLKPTTKDSVSSAINKIKKYHQIETKDDVKKIIGKNGHKIYIMELEDIFYIKADLAEVTVRIKDVDVYVRKKIGDLDSILKNKNFFRIHRSIIVNVDKINSMESIEQSKLEIGFHEIDEIVTSSKDGAKEFREYLERKSL